MVGGSLPNGVVFVLAAALGVTIAAWGDPAEATLAKGAPETIEDEAGVPNGLESVDGTRRVASTATDAEPVLGTDTRSDGTPEVEPIVPDPLTGTLGLDEDGLVDSEQRAYQLYIAGIRAFESADGLENDDELEVAIAKWQEALRVLPDEGPYARSRGALAIRLVMAHDLRFRRHGRLDDLRRQSSLLRGYQRRLPEMFPDDREARARWSNHAQARIDQIDAELRRIDGDHGTVEEQLNKSLRGEYAALTHESWRPEPDEVAWHSRPDDPRRDVEQESHWEVAPEKQAVSPGVDEPRKEGAGVLATGVLLGVAGLTGFGVGIEAMVTAGAANDFDEGQTPSERRAQIVTGTQANVRAVVGLVTGGVLTASGVIVLAVGIHRRQSSSRATAVALLPPVGTSGWGLGASGRF